MYEQSLRGLIQQFRRDLGQEDLRVVIGRINDAQMKRESWQIVHAAQVAVAKADPLATWIDSDDLNGDDNNVHNNAAGKQELGRRFAQAAVKLLTKQAEEKATGDGPASDGRAVARMSAESLDVFIRAPALPSDLSAQYAAPRGLSGGSGTARADWCRDIGRLAPLRCKATGQSQPKGHSSDGRAGARMKTR